MIDAGDVGGGGGGELVTWSLDRVGGCEESRLILRAGSLLYDFAESRSSRDDGMKVWRLVN